MSRVPFSSPGRESKRAAPGRSGTSHTTTAGASSSATPPMARHATAGAPEADSIHPSEDLNDVAAFLRAMRDEGRAAPYLPAALRHIRAKSQAEENLARLRQLGLPDGILTVEHLLQGGALSSSACMVAMCFLMCSRPELCAPLRFEAKAQKHSILHPYRTASLSSFAYLASLEADDVVRQLLARSASSEGVQHRGDQAPGRLHIETPRETRPPMGRSIGGIRLPTVPLPPRTKDAHISPGLRDPAALPLLQVRVPPSSRPSQVGPDVMDRLFDHR